MSRTAARELAVARMGEAMAEDQSVILAAHLLRTSARRRDDNGAPVSAAWSMLGLLAACRDAVQIIDAASTRPDGGK